MNTDSRLNTPLEASESILWCGQPHQGIISREGDSINIGSTLVLVMLGLPLVITAVINMNSSLSSISAVFVLALTLFYFLYGNKTHDRLIRKNTVYALTNKRAIIERSGAIQSIEFTPETKIQVTRYYGASYGTIRFWTGKESKYTKFLLDINSDTARESARHFSNDTVFDSIDDIDVVCDILRKDLSIADV
ncbi:hypothetical protein [Enterovibrio sp. 27052020O]|uniref:hypothetical protein n=1 Tax=Enterovibrio sp. 27052020O TaxID=3241166 RepID=UPI00388E6E57